MLFDGVLGQLGTADTAGFAEQQGNHVLDRSGTQIQPVGNLCVGHALADETEDA